MGGVPRHVLHKYLPRLFAAGWQSSFCRSPPPNPTRVVKVLSEATWTNSYLNPMA
jgi:hypothetical protein